MTTPVLQIDARGNGSPAGVHLNSRLAWWCHGKVQTLMFPGGWWAVRLRPEPEGGWTLYGVPVRGTRPYDLSDDGHLPIATGDDSDTLSVIGRQWCTSASDLAMRRDAAQYVGRAMSLHPCDIHGATCDTDPTRDTGRACDMSQATAGCDMSRACDTDKEPAR